jgi:hypothetical protein
LGQIGREIEQGGGWIVEVGEEKYVDGGLVLVTS